MDFLLFIFLQWNERWGILEPVCPFSWPKSLLQREVAFFIKAFFTREHMVRIHLCWRVLRREFRILTCMSSWDYRYLQEFPSLQYLPSPILTSWFLYRFTRTISVDRGFQRGCLWLLSSYFFFYEDASHVRYADSCMCVYPSDTVYITSYGYPVRFTYVLDGGGSEWEHIGHIVESDTLLFIGKRLEMTTHSSSKCLIDCLTSSPYLSRDDCIGSEVTKHGLPCKNLWLWEVQR